MTEDKKKEKKIRTAVLFCTNQKPITQIAAYVQKGICEEDDVELKAFDISEEDRHCIKEQAKGADLYLFGVTSTGSDIESELWDFVNILKGRNCIGKKAALFGNGLPEGTFAEAFMERLRNLGFDLTFPRLFIPGIIDDDGMKQFGEYGFDLRCNLHQIENPRRRKLVKCLVCGEIFDSSLGSCPVCGVGLELCVPVTEDEVRYRLDTNRQYVIVGGGIAAVSAAEAIRSRDHTGKIVMISAEQYFPINRPILTKDFEKVTVNEASLFIHDQSWYAEQNIIVETGQKVIAIHQEQKTVTMENGKTLPYDKLIYAAGAECFIPPFKGHQQNCVFSIRHLEDTKNVAAIIQKGAKNAVVIGGGVLGLEAASELMRAGLQVTVLEATPQILGRQVDRESADDLIRIMRSMHVTVEEGVSIKEIIGDGTAKGVLLEDGREYPADLVVVSCGNRGNVAAAQEAGVAVGRSIIVDVHMRTNIKDIYACGDCAEYEGVNLQLWQEASAQGKIAGANAVGEPLLYEKQILGLSLEAFGISFFAIGDPGKGQMPTRKVQLNDEVEKRRKRYWFFGRHLQGAILIGFPDEIPTITKQVTEHARYDEII